MKNKQFILFGALMFAMGIGVSIGIRKYFFPRWSRYYQEKLYQEPRPLLVQAVSFIKADEKTKKALDLGAGAGNDTVFLLKNGWDVWAVDIEEEAVKLIASREDIQPYRNSLRLIRDDFAHLPWKSFPVFNLIYAGYSLPFAQPSDFMLIWQHLVKALPSGGIFAGHFFGPDHGAFNWWVRRSMTLVTKEQLLDLFKEFKLELFEEVHEKNKRGYMEHSFSVIARRY